MSTKKKDKLLLNLLTDQRKHRHRVAMVTEEGQWNQHEPNSGMARMFVIMLLIHVVVIGGIIVYDFVGGEEATDPKVTPLSANSTSLMPAPGVDAKTIEQHRPIEEYDTYEWKSGDSLPIVAQKLQVSEETLIKINMLDKGAQIDQHTILRVPKRPVVTAIPVNPETLKPDLSAMPARKDVPPLVGLTPPTEAQTKTAPPTTVVAPPPALTIPSPAVEEKLKQNAIASTPAVMKAAPEPAADTFRAIELTPESVEPKVTPKAPETKPVAKSPEKPESKPVAKSEKQIEPARPKPVPTPSQAQKSLAQREEAAKKSENVKKIQTPTAKPVARSSSHVVKPGENLYRISQKYGVTVAALQKANGIAKPEALRNGMKLVIPGK